MNIKQPATLRRYALTSLVLFVLMNLYPICALFTGNKISQSYWFYSFLSLSFLFFFIAFTKLFILEKDLLIEAEKNKFKTNSLAAQRLTSLISTERSSQAA